MPKKPNVVASFGKSARRRKLQKVKKNTKRNRELRSPRRRDWMNHDYKDGDWDVNSRVERIMPRDERERRRAERRAVRVDVGVVDDVGDDQRRHAGEHQSDTECSDRRGEMRG